MGGMAEALDDRYGANFYRDLKTRTWDILNSLTHTGMLQLAQRFTKHEIKSSYTAGQIFEITCIATTCLLLLISGWWVSA